MTSRNFQPENPSWFVPRTYGIGWDLNFGAVAVKLGLIRPDDSLPDLEAYIPESTRKVVRWSPWAATAAAAATSALLARHPRAATQWTLGGRAKKYASGRVAAATWLGVSAVAAVPSAVVARRSEPGAQVTAAATTLGLDTLVILSALAALRDAASPGRRQPVAAAAPALALLVTGGVFVGTVRRALEGVSRSLRSQRA
ncbi:DUF5808 domain-containing protein [Corynebacterium uberis]|uniref:DUF5808 domain-containing protein n=1 Tax=Corynebacterium TaxID=1716 RepID=UPI001D0A8C20|nr:MULTISPECIES: DUF5808 domain-containing protein [Corynebacterium]MCZ9309971.1 DUF5808 domain-containing protein [Corynebacterium sp. c6VSa_13]UDL73110.1 DUF5808 domain-containing protein [Corynebacterium uberis]UDL76013.1 DUF5808 domain-containing protein [Corynebacterium uberis]UDL78225.1 DUF5808 domain-containing protein [Corynebacterium uberis]UDL80508.1 DUF5808 domain-containing protein [Corynebacterium uberis]